MQAAADINAAIREAMQFVERKSAAIPRPHHQASAGGAQVCSHEMYRMGHSVPLRKADTSAVNRLTSSSTS